MDALIAPPRRLAGPTGGVLLEASGALDALSAVEVCRDRDCETGEATFAATLDRAPVPTDLPRGVHWWRAAGIVGGVRSTAFSPAWSLTSGARTAPPESVVGLTLDLDRYGFADVVVGASSNSTLYRERVVVFRGARRGSWRPPRGWSSRPSRRRTGTTAQRSCRERAGSRRRPAATGFGCGAVGQSSGMRCITPSAS